MNTEASAARVAYDITEILPDDAVVLGFAGVVKYLDGDDVYLAHLCCELTPWEALGALLATTDDLRAQITPQREDDD